MESALIVLIPILLLSTSSLASEILNINCGSIHGFTSDNNMTWVGDGNFVHSGQTHRINQENYTDSIYERLRAFPTHRKNCYTITIGQGRKVYVTVYFGYGNYDGKARPPSFKLLVDGNELDTVDTSLDDQFYKEFIYETKRNDISICFGRLKEEEDPFVSAIEVSMLDPHMYPLVQLNSSHVLYDPWWFSPNASLRYPDDPYDRGWVDIGYTDDSDYVILDSNITIRDTSSCVDQPPVKLFDQALAPPKGKRNLTIRSTILDSDPCPVYLNMYFTDISDQTGSKYNRSFDVFMDDEQISGSSSPITPPTRTVLEFSRVNLNATNDTQITLVPTKDSTLSPIISGLEIMRIIDFPNVGTSEEDVEALKTLQKAFKVLQEWSGDPCFPRNYSWEWVDCSLENIPHITTLLLGSYGLEGSLPEFGVLSALEVIDLHNNSLNGTIPDLAAKVPKLKELNLSHNNFDCISPSLAQNSRIKLDLTGNPMVCHSSQQVLAASGFTFWLCLLMLAIAASIL